MAYHVDKTITVEGVVTEVKWENPHTWVYVEAKDNSGKVVKWSFEGAVPNQFYRRGVTPAVLKPGVRVTIKAHPARDASRNAGEMTEVLGRMASRFTPGCADPPSLYVRQLSASLIGRLPILMEADVPVFAQNSR